MLNSPYPCYRSVGNLRSDKKASAFSQSVRSIFYRAVNLYVLIRNYLSEPLINMKSFRHRPGLLSLFTLADILSRKRILIVTAIPPW